MMVTKNNIDKNYEPDYAIPPGYTLEDTLEELGMTQRELAIRSGLTAVSINRIIKGDQVITFETANKLEMVTGVPARLWNNLESNYREQLAKLEEKRKLEEELEWLNNFPDQELMKRGVLPREKNQTLRLRNSLKFLGMSSTEACEAYWQNLPVAARRSQVFDSKQGATMAWLRLGELEAQKIDCSPFNKGRFTVALRNIRKLTTLSPEEFLPKMRDLCSMAGVAVVLVPEIKGAPWHGATKWLTSKKAMILLNLRGKSEDHFWFSFFHEASHILNDKKKNLFINEGKDDDISERRANVFSQNMLIPAIYRDEVPKLKMRSQVIAFANKVGISPGIVVGQYQHMTGDWQRHNPLKRKFVWQNSK